MATKKIKINFKMPTPTAAERLHAQQQKNRKAAGLPDSSEYKKKLDVMKSEEVELDEGLKNKVGAALTAAAVSASPHAHSISVPSFNMAPATYVTQIKPKQDQEASRKAGRAFPLSQKSKELMKKEEVEPLDEISSQLKASYVAGAKKQIKQSEPYTKKGEEYRDIAKNFIAKRQKGIARANEEFEQLDEIGNTPAGRKTLGNYINRSHESGDAARIQATYDKDNFAKHTKTVAKRSSGIAKAVSRLTKEQLEKKGRFVSGPIKQPFKSNTIVTSVKEGFKMGRGNVHEYDRNPAPKDGSELENTPFHAKTEKQKKLQSALNNLGKKMKETHPKLKEETGDDNQIVITKKGTNIKKKISADIYNVFKHHGFRKEEALQEGRPSQRHPLEGHEYHKKSDEALVHIAKDAHAAAEAMKGHNTQAENKYRDQANDSATVRYYRKKHGMADWYKKKYGHVNEEVEELEEKKNLPGLWANIRAKRARGERPAKPGEKGYPKTLNIESAQDPTEGEMKGKQQGTSRKAQIVMNAAGKGKKTDNPDKFQKDPELSSEIHKT